MSVLEQCRDAVKGRGLKVVMPEGDPRIADAARLLEAGDIASVVPLGETDDRHIAAIRAQRPNLDDARAARLLSKPLFQAAAMVAVGDADALIAGAETPTRRVIEAAAMTVPLAEDVSTISSFFLMRMPDGRELVFADCAVNVAPDAPMLADIARASAASAKALLGEARLALLSFSTLSSGAGESVDMVRAASETLAIPHVAPVQADAALNPGIAAKKGIEGGDANTLIFPNLDAANIAYKLVQELGGAQALGPFLQGFARPVCDLSRGASVSDIVDATIITLALGLTGRGGEI